MSRIGLPNAYRFQIFNETGQTAATNSVNLYINRHKLGANGVLVQEGAGNYAQIITDAEPVTADGAESANQDNGANLYMGADIWWTFTGGASSDGPATLLLQISRDDGTTWPADGEGEVLDSIYIGDTVARVGYASI